MSHRKRKAVTKSGRIYTREQGGPERYYGDFRDHADVGGAQEALKAPGQRVATTDLVIAEALMMKRLTELQAARQRKVITGQAYVLRLDAASADTLKARALSGEVSQRWLQQMERHLRRACDLFGPDRDLTLITPLDVEKFRDHLTHAQGLSPQTVKHHLHSLSGVYRYAIKAQAVLSNPVSMADKPKLKRRERDWLEIPEAALLLSAATLLSASRPREALFRQAAPIIGTLLLTGARSGEALGLKVEDIDLKSDLVHIRPNEERGLKSRKSERTVPLWPQLRELLEPHIRFRQSEWLFAGGHYWEEQGGAGSTRPPRDVRKLFNRLARDTGLPTEKVRAYPMRHAYVSARLQTLDNGEPVSPFTVAREAGHSSLDMIQSVYGHVGRVRQRSPVVEYRLASDEEEGAEGAAREG